MDLSSQSLLYGCRGQIYSPRNYFKYKEANCQGPIRATHRPCRELSVQFSLVVQSCLTLCDPMNCSMPGLPVHHQLPEVTQTLVHQVGDAIQPSHPLSSPSLPAPNPNQHQGLFQ